MLVVHHVTYSINSLCHYFGRKPFATPDESRNLAWLALPTFGEAWHNNHHAFPASADARLRLARARHLGARDPLDARGGARVGRGPGAGGAAPEEALRLGVGVGRLAARRTLSQSMTDAASPSGVPTVREILDSRAGEELALNDRYLNPQVGRILRTLGFDRRWVGGEGAHLIDADGNRYLDLFGGYGVFAIGRNHPDAIAAVEEVMAARTGNLPTARRDAAEWRARRAAARARARLGGCDGAGEHGHRGRGGGDQDRARGDGPAADPLRGARIPRANARRPLDLRERGVPRGLRPAPTRHLPAAVGRPRRLGTRAAARATSPRSSSSRCRERA